MTCYPPPPLLPLSVSRTAQLCGVGRRAVVLLLALLRVHGVALRVYHPTSCHCSTRPTAPSPPRHPRHQQQRRQRQLTSTSSAMAARQRPRSFLMFLLRWGAPLEPAMVHQGEGEKRIGEDRTAEIQGGGRGEGVMEWTETGGEDKRAATTSHQQAAAGMPCF